MQLLDIPKTTRPREKLLKMGSHTLTDAELLAIMLGTGLPGQNVLQLAQALLDDFHGLAGLLQASPDDLQAAKGLGGFAFAIFYQLIGLTALDHERCRGEGRKRG